MTLLSALTYRLQRLWLAALSSARLCAHAVTQPPESLFNTETRKNRENRAAQLFPLRSHDRGTSTVQRFADTTDASPSRRHLTTFK